MPSRYPIFLDLEGKPVLVVGGGPVAQRKVLRLLEAGAQVTLVAPVVTDELRALAGAGAFDWRGRAFGAGDVAGRSLVFTATGRAEADREVVSAARAVGTPVNVADQETSGDFHVPALTGQGLLQVAVSTGGAAPGFAAVLVRELGAGLAPGLADYVRLLDEVRAALRDRFPDDPKMRQRLFAEVLEHREARRLAEGGDLPAARVALASVAGIDLF